MTHDHVLIGCQPEPLASYLKALAVLRLVSEQADPDVRGYWSGDGFVLRTRLSRDALVDFFVHDYAPTPLVAPWGGGSGFYDGDSTEGIDAILTSSNERFALYRNVISVVQSWPEMEQSYTSIQSILTALGRLQRHLSEKEKGEVKILASRIEKGLKDTGISVALDIKELERQAKKSGKEVQLLCREIKKARTKCNKGQRSGTKDGLLSICRKELPDSCVPWLDAVYVITNEGEPTYNDLLGSGGNDGALNFANSFMKHLAFLLIEDKKGRTKALLDEALFKSLCSMFVQDKIGQFDPGYAGGYNQGYGVETKDFKMNPWDFIFTLEGSLLFGGSVSRRTEHPQRKNASFPFTASCSMAGYGSSSKEDDGRSELWLPLWDRPVNLIEIGHVFAEGRSMVGQRKARTGLDFSRAVSSLGVDRGLSAFSRYSFLKRRGKSYVALPAGRVPVRYNPNVHLLDDLDPILNRLDGFLRQFSSIPAAFTGPRRRVDEAMYECAIRGDEAAFMRLVCALGQMEVLIAQRDRSKEPKLTRPLSGLRLEWITQCGADRPEVRIAAALASIHARERVGGIRSNMCGVDPAAPRNWATGKKQQCWSGSNLIERLAGVLSQRIMDASRLNTRPVAPLDSWIGVSSRDITSFLLGETDDNLLEDLLWGFTLINWESGEFSRLTYTWRTNPLNNTLPVPRPYAMIRLLFTGDEVRGKAVRMEPRILPLLRAGRTDEAVTLAAKRLRFSELSPLPLEDRGWVKPDRLFAGLLIPVSDQKHLEELALGSQDTTQIEGEHHV